jgi:hypothetical protein
MSDSIKGTNENTTLSENTLRENVEITSNRQYNHKPRQNHKT